MDSPRVVFIAGAIDGCAFWRMLMPSRVTPNATYSEGLGPAAPLGPDVRAVVVQRQSEPLNFIAIQQARLRGIRVIIDLDDDLWSLPDYHPMQQKIRIMLPWVDRCLGVADLITVSTPPLARVVEGRGFGPVRVIENAIDLDLFGRVAPVAEREKVVIGWPASAYHQRDGDLALKALVSVLRALPYVHCEFTGELPAAIRGAIAEGWLDPARIAHTPGISMSEYPAWLSRRDWDLMVAPLVDNDFNRSKSFLKFLEAGALQIPCLATDVDEYRRFCGNRLEWLLCRTLHDWRYKLNFLTSLGPFRHYWGEEVWRRVFGRHQIFHRAIAWADAVREACDPPAPRVDRRELEQVINDEIHARMLAAGT